MSFLTSIALITLCSLLIGSVLRRIGLPPLIGMLIVGIAAGPYALGLLSPSLIAISADLRRFALIVILARAGLSLDLDALKKVGRPAILLCFLPACFEIVGYVIFMRIFLGFSFAEGALTGAVMAAVSPAVVVPRMLRLQSEGYGIEKGIPQMITAGASCDDVFVIVLFTSFLSMNKTGNFDFVSVLKIPVSIVTGIAIGLLIGLAASLFFKVFRMRDTVKILIFLSVSFFLVTLEDSISGIVPFSGLLAVISLGIMLRIRDKSRAEHLSARFGKIWVFAEILLFVLVGAEVDISCVAEYGLKLLPVLFISLAFRAVGVLVCLIKTSLNTKERIFCAIAYIPKATVQAAIGGIALSAGLECGKTILTCAVLAILITAPIGAFLTDFSYKKLLVKSTPKA